MPRNGWIKLYRKLLDDPDFLEKPFDKAHAWIDLLLLANAEEHTFMSKGETITLRPGQLIFGYRQLAARWGWSKNKVCRFIRKLADDGSVTIDGPQNGPPNGPQSGTRNGTLLSLVKWASYQGQRDTSRTTKRYTSRDSDGPLYRSIEKNKEEKNKTARRSGSYLAQKRASEDEELAAWAKEGGQ